MPGGELPHRLRPQRLVGSHICGDLSLARLPRLAALSTAGTVSLSLQFSEDGARRCLVTGMVRALLRLPCQRCLDEMDWCFESRVQWGVVADDAAAARLPKSLDPVLLESDGSMDLDWVVGDEVLLGTPMNAMHDLSICPARYNNLLK